MDNPLRPVANTSYDQKSYSANGARGKITADYEHHTKVHKPIFCYPNPDPGFPRFSRAATRTSRNVY